jgi:hypothetical protein
MSLEIPHQQGLSSFALEGRGLPQSLSRWSGPAHSAHLLSERQRRAQVAALTANRGEIEAEKLIRVLGSVTDRGA